ncbi:hypothetical protein SEUBUCD646_0J00760 [Saccharomyces eubayanus]|uniref:Mannosyltransferase yur1 n=2 Tax=Saccharomyces TaxID=4930 RepID=A0A6C1EA25_SACPS|nr:mannosyltransferase yur1 [Saccharomyces pastorianus]CAI1508227.1 hypothetical protein SEUBUCD650_0J00770 [Saccharomyces eubayanus]CAI1520918.1 hypothetical protein SEUBUCD646_0J00760 [Saccharomyces eubayanus]
MANKGLLYALGIFLPLWTFLICIFFKQIFLIHKSQNIDNSYTYLSQRAKEQYDSSRRRNYLPDLKLSRNSYEDYTLDYRRQDEFGCFYQRENATILMLVRNSELEGALDSMRSLEDRFNKRYRYDWTFLNDVPFDQEFIEATTAMASGKTQYALIPPADWNRPQWINETLFEARLHEMETEGVLYGGSRSYRNMCRFNSGFFFKQSILNNYDYYFRVEPNVEYYCDFPYDPFRVMRLKGKKYGFVISLYEYEETIPTLWNVVEEYLETNEGKILSKEDSAYAFLTDSNLVGKYYPVVEANSDYNLCHFWSNFEIGDLNFFRSDEYKTFFETLDSKGGFYYERWGDAPVHSIGVSLLLRPDEIIHFDELGYFHSPFGTCPASHAVRLDQRCRCKSDDVSVIDIEPHSCLMRWWKNGSGKHFLKEVQGKNFEYVL